MVKEAFVVDRFKGEYFGGLVDFEGSEDYPGRKKPVIKLMRTHPTENISRAEKAEFPYSLTEENINRYDDGDFPIIYLEPTKDVPELTEEQYKKTHGYKEKESDKEEIERWKERYRDKEKELESLRKDLRTLRSVKEEQEEREKASTSSQSNGVKCTGCDSSNPEQRWEDNGGYCPSCGDVTLDEVKG